VVLVTVTPVQRGFPGHFIGWRSCCFRLCHDVGTVRVSTVGCWHSREGGVEPEEIGAHRKFETFVFRLTDSLNDFGIPDIDSSEIDSEGYNDWQAAEAGHAAMVAKWTAEESS
jgi:hypothetical protein